MTSGSYLLFVIFVIIGTSLTLSKIWLPHISSEEANSEMDEDTESTLQMLVITNSMCRVLLRSRVTWSPPQSFSSYCESKHLENAGSGKCATEKIGQGKCIWCLCEGSIVLRSVCNVFQNFKRIFQACDGRRTSQS